MRFEFKREKKAAAEADEGDRRGQGGGGGEEEDPRIRLTARGWQEAEACGVRIRDLISGDGAADWKVYFYVSPYRQTLETLRSIGLAFKPSESLGSGRNLASQSRILVGCSIPPGFKIIATWRRFFTSSNVSHICGKGNQAAE